MLENKLSRLNAIVKSNKDYREGRAVIEDAEYDRMIKEFVADFGEDSLPINQLDGKVKYVNLGGNKKEFNPIPMGGLSKITSQKDFEFWITKFNLQNEEITMSPKFDGVSCGICNFDNGGDKVQAYIKGDENMSYNISPFYELVGKKMDSFDDSFHIGEIIISNKNFERFSTEYKNVRNFVAGKLNPNSKTSDYLLYFDYIRYNVIEKDETIMGWKTKTEVFDYLNKFNRNEVPYVTVTYNDMKDSFEEFFNTLYKKWNVDYEIDGIVVEVNKMTKRKELGLNTIGNPNHSIAVKLEFGDIKEVELKSFSFTLDKDGNVNPAITTDLVILDGAECGKNIYVDNVKYIKENNLYVGKKILIKRGGKIIPRIHDARKNGVDKTFEELISDGTLPKVCPSCGEELCYNSTTVKVQCKNEYCKDKILRSTLFFFETIGCKGIAERTIENLYGKLYEEYMSSHDLIIKILNLEKSDFRYMEGYSNKKSVIIFDSIHDNLNKVGLAKFMHSTNLFSGLGETKIQWVLRHWNITFDSIRKLFQLKEEEIFLVNGFADESVRILMEGIKKFNSLLPRIIGYISRKEEKHEEIVCSGELFKNETVCFTGFRNKFFEDMIKQNGGEIENKFNKTVTCLVVKEKNQGTTKEKKAIENGIKILSEEDIKEMFGLNNVEEEIENVEEEVNLW